MTPAALEAYRLRLVAVVHLADALRRDRMVDAALAELLAVYREADRAWTARGREAA